MDHPFSNDVLDTILEYFDDNEVYPSNIDADGWDEILQEQFNTTVDYYNYSDYMRAYPTMLDLIHFDMDEEVDYWDCQKMISLYMYIVAKEIIADCKEHIIEKFYERHEGYSCESESENDSSDSSDDEPDPFTNELLIPVSITQ